MIQLSNVTVSTNKAFCIENANVHENSPPTVSIDVIGCQERLVCQMTHDVSSETLNSAHIFMFPTSYNAQTADSHKRQL